MDTMTAILLAGGESSRFWPFKHKMLTSFLGSPLLSWHYEQFLRFGIKKCIVITQSESDNDIRNVVPPKKLSVTYIKQKSKGQGNGLLASEEAEIVGPVLIVNASDVYDDAFVKEMKTVGSKNSDAVIVGARNVASYFPGGYIRLKADGRIDKIVEKPKQGTEPGTLVSIGAYVIPNVVPFYDALRKAHKNPSAQFENAINILFQKGTSGIPLSVDAPWYAIKFPWHVLSVSEAALGSITSTSIDRTVTIGKNVVIDGPVFIGRNVRICEGVKITGPTYIGEGSIIGNNSMIRMSHLGKRVVTGYSTEITRSYVGNDCWFHTNYIGDSIIGNNVSIGSGFVTANLRLDESDIFSVVKNEKVNTERKKLGAIIGDGTRIGVQGSTMPGIKIGSRSIVGAGVVLSEDLSEGSYCRRQETVIITKNTRMADTDRDAFRRKL